MSIRSTGKTIALAAAVLLAASPATAQTWAGQRKTPRLSEIIAIDKTGEPGWRFGEEDLAGDGVATFKQPEQAVDIRTAYATTDATRFWARVYVSDPSAVGSNISAYVFIDADHTTTTGGPATATEINAKLTVSNPPAVGYEYVVELRGNGTVTQFWKWTDAPPKYVPTVLPPAPQQAVGEAGKDLDPIRLNGDVHGYLQGSIDLGLVGFANPNVCDANIFFRAVDETGTVSDLDVGLVSSCKPADSNGDGVPDVIVPAGACTKDDQCPGGGICVNSVCVIASPCVIDADCKVATQLCSVDGFCLPKPGGTCSVNADCDDLVCNNSGTCVGCTFGGDQCGATRRCGPSGLCIAVSVSSVSVGAGAGAGGAGGSGISIQPGDNVQGGACSCSVIGRDGQSGSLAALLGLSLPLVGLARRRRRASRSGGGCAR